MRTLIVFESMYGNTHSIATALATGLGASGEVEVVPVARATAERVGAADLLVVGGPTHVHSMSSSTTRKGAVDNAVKAEGSLALDPDASADGPGLRDWFGELAAGGGRPAIAFDTRVSGPVLLTGHASHAIASKLTKHGFSVLAGPESFLVDKANTLLDGELARAQEWGSHLAELALARLAPH